MPPRTKQYLVWYKNDDTMMIWHLCGIFNRTDALGTANNLLKDGYDVKINPSK